MLATFYRTHATPTPRPTVVYLNVIFGSNHIVGGSRLQLIDPASGALPRTVVPGGVALRIAVSGAGVR